MPTHILSSILYLDISNKLHSPKCIKFCKKFPQKRNIIGCYRFSTSIRSLYLRINESMNWLLQCLQFFYWINIMEMKSYFSYESRKTYLFDFLSYSMLIQWWRWFVFFLLGFWLKSNFRYQFFFLFSSFIVPILPIQSQHNNNDEMKSFEHYNIRIVVKRYASALIFSPFDYWLPTTIFLKWHNDIKSGH